MTVEQALAHLKSSLGLDDALRKPHDVLEAARSQLSVQLDPELSLKQQIKAVCEACDIQTHWVASPRAAPPLPAAPAFARTTVSVRWLKKFVEANAATLAGKTTSEVAATLLVPQTQEQQCAVTAALAGQRLHPETVGDTAQCAGDATCLISHAWSATFLDTAHAVIEWGEAQPQPSEVFAWMDVFADNHHVPPPTSRENWDAAFGSAVGDIGTTLLVLTPWDDPSVVRRLWCAWEFVCTVAGGGALELLLPPREKARLDAALETDIDAMRRLVDNLEGRRHGEAAGSEQLQPEPERAGGGGAQPMGISLEHAQLREEGERSELSSAILRRVAASEAFPADAGWAELNARLLRELREWTLRYTLKFCKAKAGGGGEETWRYTHELAEHVAESDEEKELKKAESLLIEAHTARREGLGEEHPDTQRSAEALAAVRARLPAEEGVPPAGGGAALEVTPIMPPDESGQYYSVVWRAGPGAVHTTRHRYSEFDALRNNLCAPQAPPPRHPPALNASPRVLHTRWSAARLTASLRDVG